MSHVQRLAFFAAIASIGVRGGYFCFATHNLESLEAANTPIRPTTGPRYAIVDGGAHGGRLETYYVSPDEQLNQLRRWFEEIRVYDVDGERVAPEALRSNRAPWLTFLCPSALTGLTIRLTCCTKPNAMSEA